MRIGLIVAMDKEFEQLKSVATEMTTEHKGGRDFVLARIGQNYVVMLQCGIGKVNAAVGTTLLITNYQPSLVISTGVAGGASTSLEVADVVVSTECMFHDVYCGDECAKGQIMGLPVRYASNPVLVAKAQTLACKTPVRKGLIVTGDWFVNSREKMRSILDDFPEAMAVDMESCAIAQTCYIFSTPFISFRIISDIPLKDHKAQMYYDFWQRMAEGSFEVIKALLMKL